MDTQRSFSLSTIAVSIVFIGLFAASAFAADDKPRVWRHEGLLIDNRDVTFIQEHLDQEPWKSAWEFQGPDVGLNLEHGGDRASFEKTKHEWMLKEILRMGLLMAVEPNQERGDYLAQLTGGFPKMFDQIVKKTDVKLSPVDMARTLALYAVGVEYARRVDGWAESELKKSQDWLRGKIDKLKSEEFSPVGSAWFSAACLAVGVVLEDDPLYQQGEKKYLDLLQAEFDDNGSLKTLLPLPEYVELVTGMAVTAEIANHHSDLFYGHDLYHESFGPKNMHQVCSHLFSQVLADAGNELKHWGWLELAVKTFGEPAWLEALRDRRPVFDVWTGGGVTLSHARWLGTGLPDFGMAEDGFHWLHNRKDLSCWQYSSRWYDINKADFYVEDGIFKTKGGRDHWLLTDRMYANFILRLEYKIGPGSNSGIMIWAPIPGRPSKTGFEVQLLDDTGQPPRKDGSGALYNVAPPIVNAQKPAGEWNELEIICDNPRLTVHMNGTLIQDLNLDDYPVTQGRRRRGYIGLQDHSHRVAFRNVRIKPLD